VDESATGSANSFQLDRGAGRESGRCAFAYTKLHDWPNDPARKEMIAKSVLFDFRPLAPPAPTP
jgi:hypothetical protein